jgi:hypothetical protein
MEAVGWSYSEKSVHCSAAIQARRVKRKSLAARESKETTVSVLKEANQAARAEYMRSGLRLNSRVKIQVEWTEKGKKHTVEGYTIDISPNGCLAILPQGFGVGQKLRLKNPITRAEGAANIIWRGHEGRVGWEFGLQLESPSEDFWGVVF